MDTLSGRAIPRVMFYSHDSYGLGHLRRTLALARHFRARWPTVAQLIVTGSPLPQNFSFGHGIDYVKLPSVLKVGRERYESRSISLSFREVRDLRRDLIFTTASSFRPDVLIVDHAPAGLKREIVLTLRHLKAISQTRLVLGLRDVVDDAETVRRQWARQGVYDLLDNLYDLILVYGQPDVYDVIAEYKLSPRAARKTRFVGYLGRNPATRSPEHVRAELRLRTGRLVLLMAGGGEDGYELVRAVFESLDDQTASHQFDCLAIGGPLMPAAQRERLRALAGSINGLRFVEFARDVESYIKAADVVISMGGYNSVTEILSFGRPAIIVPRVAPRKEQLIRATALSRRGLVRMIHPADLMPERLMQEVDELLGRSVRTEGNLNLDGLPAAAAELEATLARPAQTTLEERRPAGVA
jgi:predicted glycosyltransferase